MTNESHIPASEDRLSESAPPRAARLQRKRRMLRLLKNHWAWATSCFLLGCAVTTMAVLWLAHSATLSHEERIDVEKQWAGAIAQYGIEPVFPPEEDFAVGDLFVSIVSDDDPDENILNRVTEHTPFRARSVKLDHVDVREALEKIYRELPFFGDIAPALTPGGGQGEFDLF